MSSYCGPVNVTISESGSTSVSVSSPGAACVSIQPFSVSAAVNHATTHYIGGSDPLNHNQLSGLQGGATNEYYHLDEKTFESITNGVVSFVVDIPSGIKSTGILFPKVFSDPPLVLTEITSPYQVLYLSSINSITTSGFEIGFSSKINNTGYKLQILGYIKI